MNSTEKFVFRLKDALRRAIYSLIFLCFYSQRCLRKVLKINLIDACVVAL